MVGYRLQGLPNSLAPKAVNNQRFFNFYQSHLNFPHPFGFKICLILADLNIYKGPVLAFQYSVIPPWELPAVMFCRYFPGSKRNLSDSEIRSIFLNHKDEHKDSLSIFTDGSKSNAGIGFGAFRKNLVGKELFQV